MDRLPRWLAFLMITGFLAVAGGVTVFYLVTKQPDSFITQKIVKPVVGFLSGFKQFEDVVGSNPEFSLTSNELQASFAADEAKAGAMYNTKLIEVSGVISSIAAPTDTNRVILLEVDGLSNISCQMDPRFNERLANVAAGSTIRIRGICNGMKKDDLLGSLDVLLNRCVLME